MTGLPPWAVVSPARARHIERVVGLIEGWIAALNPAVVEADRWRRAAWLHDALRDAPESELIRWAGAGRRDFLHGPAAAACAAAAGETDEGVLAAVRWHTLGWAEWDQVGRVLYCADFLEPGRDHHAARRRELAERYPADPMGVLFHVAQWRIERLIKAGWAIPEPTWRFWNALPRPARDA